MQDCLGFHYGAMLKAAYKRTQQAATMLGVVACMLAVVCKRMQQLPTMLGLVVHRGKDRTLLEVFVNHA